MQVLRPFWQRSIFIYAILLVITLVFYRLFIAPSENQNPVQKDVRWGAEYPAERFLLVPGESLSTHYWNAVTVAPKTVMYSLTGEMLARDFSVYSYSVLITDIHGRTIWQGANLMPVDSVKTFEVGIARDFLSAGDYQMVITEKSKMLNTITRSVTFPFHLILSGSRDTLSSH